MGNKKQSRCLKDKDFVRALTRGLAPKEKKSFAAHLHNCSFCCRKFFYLLDLQRHLQSREAELKDFLRAEELKELRRQASRELRQLEIRQPLPAQKAGKRVPVLRWVTSSLLFVILLTAGLWFFFLRQPQPVFRNGLTPSLSLFSPSGKINQPPLEFHWKAIPGIQVYRFELIDESLEVIYSQQVSSPLVRLPEPKRRELLRGKIYIWTVEAFDDAWQRVASGSTSFIIE